MILYLSSNRNPLFQVLFVYLYCCVLCDMCTVSIYVIQHMFHNLFLIDVEIQVFLLNFFYVSFWGIDKAPSISHQCLHCVINVFFVCWNISFAIISVWNVNGIWLFLTFTQSSPLIENGYVQRQISTSTYRNIFLT
jgi:hypothetical protein